MVDKSTDHGKLLSICFDNNIDSRYPFPFKFLGKSRARGKNREKKPNCPTITSFPRSVLLSNLALHQSAREKSRDCLKKKKIFRPASFPGSLCFPSLQETERRESEKEVVLGDLKKRFPTKCNHERLCKYESEYCYLLGIKYGNK